MPGFTKKKFTNYDIDKNINDPKIDHPSSSVIFTPYPVKIDNGVLFPEIPQEHPKSSHYKPGD